MHNLASTFVLGFHGCDRSVGERLLNNAPFEPSTNEYDWLGSGVYFWQANPDRALLWAREQATRNWLDDPFVVGSVIDLGFCLDLTSSNGIHALQAGYAQLRQECASSGKVLPENRNLRNQESPDRVLRFLDCMVVNYIHQVRLACDLPPFDSVCGLFPEGGAAFEGSLFREKTHLQICVRNQDNIHGVFRVHPRYFSSPSVE